MRRSILALALPALTAATNAPTWFRQSWFFQWDPPGTPFPVPITAQCETIHITWQRSTATGPDGVAPYYLQVYTSNFIFPFIIPVPGSDPKADLAIPFAPGTQYQICMFDSRGHTGGCQAVYTVYPSTNSSTPNCANFSMPADTLSVKSESSLGSLSMYGWIDSCTDLRITPQNGTPPFTFTVAPALHPPLNITSNDMKPINWTVALNWASPFFISLVDSTGLSWSNGPIHSGDGKTNCLATDSAGGTNGHITVGETVGAAIAGVVLGALFSILAAFYISKRREKTQRYKREMEPTPFNHYSSLESPAPEASPFSPGQQAAVTSVASVAPKRSLRLGVHNPSSSTTTIPQEFDMEPFQYDTHRRTTLRPSTAGDDSSQPQRESWHNGYTRSPSASANMPPSDHQESHSQVYVIHHDSGRAPVSVITSRGTEVVELPPGYSPEFRTASGSSSPMAVPPVPRMQKPPAGPANGSDTRATT